MNGRGGTSVFLVDIPKGETITVERHEGISIYRWVKKEKLKQIVMNGQLSDWFSLWAYSLAVTNHRI